MIQRAVKLERVHIFSQCSGKSSTSSLTVYGTCYSSSECSSKGGTVDGNCAAGFGVCCVFTVSTCGSTVTNNCTYLQNPSYPSSESSGTSCSYSVTPKSDDICQLRLGTKRIHLLSGTFFLGKQLSMYFQLNYFPIAMENCFPLKNYSRR